MSDVEFERVTKTFGGHDVIKGVDLSIRSGEFAVFVGPSGCGKSTLLRMISGLETVTGGRLRIGGTDVTRLPPARRGVAMVFQSYALYPHMTVEENMSFGLRMTGTPREEVDRRVADAARILQLEALLARRPKQLSGGQRQRVAIGRAIVREPLVFLFDEPLSNLDAALRVQMRVEIARLHQEIGATMIYVTHDQVEAMTMADRIVVLNGGRVEQVGSPLDLYERPANLFVAGFLGQPAMNFAPAEIAAVEGSVATARLRTGHTVAVRLAERTAPPPGAPVTLGIRPDALALSDGEGEAVQVEIVEHLGDETIAYLRSAVADDRLVVKLDKRSPVRPGDRTRLVWQGADTHLFGADGVRLSAAR